MQSRVAVILTVLTAFVVGEAPAPAQTRNPGGEPLPVPRFVSLRRDEVNVRAGPGMNYPIEWKYMRQNMPVEVLQDFQYWRKIRDVEGTEGWVHHSMLSGKRYALVTGDMRPLRRRPEPESGIVAQVEPGVIAQILECQGQWCRLDAAGIKGWLARAEFWGVYPNEAVK